MEIEIEIGIVFCEYVAFFSAFGGAVLDVHSYYEDRYLMMQHGLIRGVHHGKNSLVTAS